MAHEHGEVQAMLAYIRSLQPLLDAIAQDTHRLHQTVRADGLSYESRMKALQELKPGDRAEQEKALLAEMAAAARALGECVDTLVTRNRTRMKSAES
jgi:hypothetical protein